MRTIFAAIVLVVVIGVILYRAPAPNIRRGDGNEKKAGASHERSRTISAKPRIPWRATLSASAEVSPTGRAVLANTRGSFSFSDAGKLTLGDLQEFKKQFRAIKAPADKRAIMEAFAYIGDSEAALLIQNMVTNDLAGVALGREDELAVMSGLESLGIIAGRDEDVLRWLLDAASEQRWKGSAALWKSSVGPAERILVSSTIRAAGLSLREDVPEKLKAICLNAERNGFYGHRGAVVDAVIRVEAGRENGEEYGYKNLLEDFDFSMRHLRKWTRETEIGRQWRAWYDKEPPMPKETPVK